MAVLYLAIVFAVIIVLLSVKRPLWQALLGGIFASMLLYRIDPLTSGKLVLGVFTKWSSLSVLLALYLITFLQRVLAARDRIKLAQQKLDSMYKSKKITLIGSCLFIGLLPSAAAMVLCGQIVREATAGSTLSETDKAFTANWFRHIPESTLPTYSSVLLMLSFSGISLPSFLPCMIIPVIVLALLGNLATLRKIPKEEITEKPHVTLRDWFELLRYVWPILLAILIILIFRLEVVYAVLIAIAAAVPGYRISLQELKGMFVSAIDRRMLTNTFLVLVLKDFFTAAGVLAEIPKVMDKLPLPSFLAFGILFFVLTAISGAPAALAMGMPIIMAAMPASVPLMVYLMCSMHAASQLSPTHVCLVVASDYFDISLGALIRKTLPVSLLFFVLMTGYYLVLSPLF